MSLQLFKFCFGLTKFEKKIYVYNKFMHVFISCNVYVTQNGISTNVMIIE